MLLLSTPCLLTRVRSAIQSLRSPLEDRSIDWLWPVNFCLLEEVADVIQEISSLGNHIFYVVESIDRALKGFGVDLLSVNYESNLLV